MSWEGIDNQSESLLARCCRGRQVHVELKVPLVGLMEGSVDLNIRRVLGLVPLRARTHVLETVGIPASASRFGPALAFHLVSQEVLISWPSASVPRSRSAWLRLESLLTLTAFLHQESVITAYIRDGRLRSRVFMTCCYSWNVRTVSELCMFSESFFFGDLKRCGGSLGAWSSPTFLSPFIGTPG
ncbi:hypothetical protein Tco_0874170 [Tanacetum coccineum]|uniref:Uncharacterized protein n=1 Tax=Tanacetum coccineum TaxID=301880 RepID=A0ABQ5BQ17_9ASTR